MSSQEDTQPKTPSPTVKVISVIIALIFIVYLLINAYASAMIWFAAVRHATGFWRHLLAMTMTPIYVWFYMFNS